MQFLLSRRLLTGPKQLGITLAYLLNGKKQAVTQREAEGTSIFQGFDNCGATGSIPNRSHSVFNISNKPETSFVFNNGRNCAETRIADLYFIGTLCFLTATDV